MKDLPKLITSVVLCEITGLLGTFFTASAIPTWYQTLNKPFFSPPNWVFGPVWIILYFLMGVAFFLVWKEGWNKKKVKTAGKLFLAQLGLNFIWTPIFFGLKSPLLALIVILALLALILATMKKFRQISEVSFYLLIPYWLWVSFASILNIAIVILN